MDDTIRLARGVGIVIALVSILLYEIFAGQLSGSLFGCADYCNGVPVSENPGTRDTTHVPELFTVYLFQAFGKGKISLFLGVTRWLVSISHVVYFNGIFGMYGIVWSQVTADMLTAILSFYVFFRFRPRMEDEEVSGSDLRIR